MNIVDSVSTLKTLVFDLKLVIGMGLFCLWAFAAMFEGFLNKDPLWRYLCGFSVGLLAAVIVAPFSPFVFLLNFFLFSALSICAIFDIFEMMVPQSCSFLPCPLFLFLVWLGFPTQDFILNFLSTIFVFSSMFILSFLIKRFYNKTGLGMGDVQMFATVASLLGFEKVLFVVQGSSILGLLFMLMHQMLSHRPLVSIEKFPFVPCILIACFFVQLFYKGLVC